MAEIETVKFKKMEWINIVNPDPEAVNFLREKYRFHELDLEDCLTENQRSKIDEYSNYLFIILHFPYYDRSKKNLAIEEVDIFLGADFFITLHYGSLRALKKLLDTCKENFKTRKKYLGSGSGYLLYEFVSTLFDDSFVLTDELGEEIDEVEKSVFVSESEQKDMLKDILILKKNIITFRRCILPQRTVIAQLEHKNKKFLPENLEVYFDDVVDKIEKMWNNLENLKELIESLQETNESIISHTTSNVIRILTIFSVVMLPLSVITGLYGMNVDLPYAENSAIFKFIALTMVGVVLTMLIFFKYKRWM